MLKQERIRALQELARLHPTIEHVGTIWKNTFNPKSRGIRWRPSDLEMFREFQSNLLNTNRSNMNHHG